MRRKKLLVLSPQYSKSTVYRHGTRLIAKTLIGDRTFTPPRIRLESGMKKACSVRTKQSVLHKAGYSYLQGRKKRLLMAKDLKKRVYFGRKVKG